MDVVMTSFGHKKDPNVNPIKNDLKSILKQHCVPTGFAIFTRSGYCSFVTEWLIFLASGSAMSWADMFKNLPGISSCPVAFLGFIFCSQYFISYELVSHRWKDCGTGFVKYSLKVCCPCLFIAWARLLPIFVKNMFSAFEISSGLVSVLPSLVILLMLIFALGFLRILPKVFQRALLLLFCLIRIFW